MKNTIVMANTPKLLKTHDFTLKTYSGLDVAIVTFR